MPSWERWLAARNELPCLVARELSGEGGPERDPADRAAVGGLGAAAREQADGAVLGWAALTPASTRAVYRGVAAISIYVDSERRRQGVGRLLLLALVQASEAAGIWTLEAGIFPENAASIALHESCGFRLVGVRRRVGQMAEGSWRDVLLYERRSEIVGVD